MIGRQLWLQNNILKKYLAKLIYKLQKPVACRPIATRWLSAKRLVRNVLISHAPKLKSKMWTDPKSGYTRWLQNYCPVKLWTDHWRKLWRLNKVLSEKCQGRPTPWSFSTNVKVDPTPISLLRQKPRTPNFNQTAVNCLLRKAATMREMKSSPVLWDLIYCPRVWITSTNAIILVNTKHW